MKPTGIIQSVSGVVKVIALDGKERTLNVGDVVELGEQVITGAVVIVLSDGTTMKVGQGETFTLNTETSPTEAQSDVAEIQAALQTDPNFDPSELPATAAGNPAAGAGGNSGSSIVEVYHIESKSEVTSGFKTRGIEQGFNEGSEDDAINNSLPTAGTITVMLDEDDLAVAEFDEAHYEVLELAFETATGLDAQRASSEGVNDEAPGDDLTPTSPTVLSGALVADFGGNGPGDIVFNLADTQPTGLSSGGEALQYHVSADGHSLIAYTLSTVAEIIFSAEITDVDAGLFRLELYGPLDHSDGNTEDNLLIDLGFIISDIDGDTELGVLQLDVDDDSPVIINSESSSVDEDGLNGGNEGDSYEDGGDITGAALTAEGDLNILWGADDGGSSELSVAFDSQVAPSGLSSNGAAITYSINDDAQILVAHTGSDAAIEANRVFTVELSDLQSGSYSFELLSNLDHDVVNTEDDIGLSFAFTVKDSDGDTVNSSFTVTVNDDGPVAAGNIELSLQEDVSTVSEGNVFDSGSSKGADGAVVNLDSSPEGVYGSLELNADGSYVYTLNNAAANIQALATSERVTETFEYTMVDGDGDTASGQLTVTIMGTNEVVLINDEPEITNDKPVIILGESSGSAAEFTITNHDDVSSAGYHNSYGYYVKTFDADGNALPTVGVILENDVHFAHDGFAKPITVTGYSQEQIGYFLIPHGGGANSELTDGEVVSFSEAGGQWKAFAADGSALVGAGSAVLFDVAALNKDGQDHMQDNELVGNQNWEDLQIPNGDGDYNDVNVNVEWTGVTVTGKVVEEVSYGADGEGSIDFSLDNEDDVIIVGADLESNGHDIMFKAVDSTGDGHNDQIIGYTADDGDVLIIDHVLEGAYEVSILGPIDDVEGETHTDVDITAHVAVTDGDGDMAYADLAIHIDIDMHQVLATPAALD